MEYSNWWGDLKSVSHRWQSHWPKSPRAHIRVNTMWSDSPICHSLLITHLYSQGVQSSDLCDIVNLCDGGHGRVDYSRQQTYDRCSESTSCRTAAAESAIGQFWSTLNEWMKILHSLIWCADHKFQIDFMQATFVSVQYLCIHCGHVTMDAGGVTLIHCTSSTVQCANNRTTVSNVYRPSTDYWRWLIPSIRCMHKSVQKKNNK